MSDEIQPPSSSETPPPSEPPPSSEPTPSFEQTPEAPKKRPSLPPLTVAYGLIGLAVGVGVIVGGNYMLQGYKHKLTSQLTEVRADRDQLTAKGAAAAHEIEALKALNQSDEAAAVELEQLTLYHENLLLRVFRKDRRRRSIPATLL